MDFLKYGYTNFMLYIFWNLKEKDTKNYSPSNVENPELNENTVEIVSRKTTFSKRYRIQFESISGSRIDQIKTSFSNRFGESESNTFLGLISSATKKLRKFLNKKKLSKEKT